MESCVWPSIDLTLVHLTATRWLLDMLKVCQWEKFGEKFDNVESLTFICVKGYRNEVT